jgi:acetyl-CoA acetyltransferase
MAGTHGLVVAGGVEVMTVVPLGASLAQPSVGRPYGERLLERYRAGAGLLPPGLVAEEVASRWSLARADLDAWVVGSYGKALRAQLVQPTFLLPVPTSAGAASGGAGSTTAGSRDGASRGGGATKAAARRGSQPQALSRDEALEHPRALAELAGLPPAYLNGGVITAANMAAEGDGAAAVLLASPARAGELGLVPKARIVSLAAVGGDPAVWPAASVPATWKVLEHAGLGPSEVDRWYVHESSAAAVLAWLEVTGADPACVNPGGGALASTAPVGAVGAGMFASAVGGFAEDVTQRRAVVSVAAENGVGTACLLERA